MENKTKIPTRKAESEPPPIFSSWKGWYALVLGALVLYIILLYLFTSLY